MMARQFRCFPNLSTVLHAAATLALVIALPPQAADAQQADGERQFRQRCASCHSLDPNGRGAGPSLAGIIGRAAGSLEGARYSRALPESGVIWDAETLDRYLSDPGDLVPGTTMRIRVTDPAQRAAIIEFLQGV